MTDLARMVAFEEILMKLGQMFTPIEDSKKEIYFEQFSRIPIPTLQEAANVLIGQHPYKRFPLPAEIWRAIAAVRKSAAYRRAMREIEAATGDCLRCGSTGWAPGRVEKIGSMEYQLYEHCSCSLGRSMRAGHEKLLREAAQRPASPKLTYPNYETPDDGTPDDGEEQSKEVQ